MIPQDFESWKYRIEQKCGIPLTLPFVQGRLAVYENEELPETKRFISKYGEEHYWRVREWFARVAMDLDIAERDV